MSRQGGGRRAAGAAPPPGAWSRAASGVTLCFAFPPPGPRGPLSRTVSAACEAGVWLSRGKLLRFDTAWCRYRRFCNRCGPGDGVGGVGACSPDHTPVCLVYVKIICLILLSESVVDLDCCVDLQKHSDYLV